MSEDDVDTPDCVAVDSDMYMNSDNHDPVEEDRQEEDEKK
jgi:hypothetical protein